MLQLPAYIAHRGASFRAPENTLIAFQKAKELGASWVECDVAMSADCVPVIFHDDELSRTTNGYGKLADKILPALKQLDAGSWFAKRFQGETIPTLQETLALCQQLDLGVNLEIKPQFFECHHKFSKVLETIQPFWDDGYYDILISSFSIRSLSFFYQHAPDIPRGLLMQSCRPDWLYFAKQLKCFSIHVCRSIATNELISKIKSAGYNALCYTVNDKNEAQHLKHIGVDAMFSDHI